MSKILKVTLSIFILSLVFNLTSVDAFRHLAIKHVNLPRLRGIKTVVNRISSTVKFYGMWEIN